MSAWMSRLPALVIDPRRSFPPDEFCRGANVPTAITTKPLHTQLTPSSAERARRERRHPKASKSLKTKLSSLDPLENSIGAKRTLQAASARGRPPSDNGQG